MSCLSKVCFLNVGHRELTVIRLLDPQLSSGNQKGLIVFLCYICDAFTINHRAHNQKINLIWDCETYIKKTNSIFV